MCSGFPQVNNPYEDIRNCFENYVPGTTLSDENTDIVVTKINLVYYMNKIDKINEERQDLI